MTGPLEPNAEADPTALRRDGPVAASSSVRPEDMGLDALAQLVEYSRDIALLDKHLRVLYRREPPSSPWQGWAVLAASAQPAARPLDVLAVLASQ